jgi:hypothetical protein
MPAPSLPSIPSLPAINPPPGLSIYDIAVLNRRLHEAMDHALEIVRQALEGEIEATPGLARFAFGVLKAKFTTLPGSPAIGPITPEPGPAKAPAAPAAARPVQPAPSPAASGSVSAQLSADLLAHLASLSASHPAVSPRDPHPAAVATRAATLVQSAGSPHTSPLNPLSPLTGSTPASCAPHPQSASSRPATAAGPADACRSRPAA